MESTITATEFARNLSDVLNRVHYRNERFVIMRNGVRVAEIRPPAPPAARPLSDILKEIGDRRMPGDGFADDLERIRASQGTVEPPEWP